MKHKRSGNEARGAGGNDAVDPPVDEQLRRIERRKPFRWGLLAGAIAAVAAVLLVVQNGRTTAFEWLWLDFDAPLWLLLALTFAAGMVVGHAVRALWHRARARSAARRQALEAAREQLVRP